jgi:hypothetical protein
MLLTLLGFNTIHSQVMKPKTTARYNNDGELIQPKKYREWIFIGTPLTPHDMNNGKAAFPEFHNVYIDPESWEHYKINGEFRDGTVIIKELVSVGTKQSTSGKGYFMGEYLGLEAAIKDSNHNKDEPGNWAYYSFTNHDGGEYKPTAKAQPTQNCNVCHQTAQQDWVYIQHYPVLRAALKKQ